MRSYRKSEKRRDRGARGLVTCLQIGWQDFCPERGQAQRQPDQGKPSQTKPSHDPSRTTPQTGTVVNLRIRIRNRWLKLFTTVTSHKGNERYTKAHKRSSALCPCCSAHGWDFETSVGCSAHRGGDGWLLALGGSEKLWVVACSACVACCIHAWRQISLPRLASVLRRELGCTL